MAKSKAKKVREKRSREGKRNPELSRSPFAFTDMRTRKTKTKKDILYCKKRKDQSFQNGDDWSYLFFLLKHKKTVIECHTLLVTFTFSSYNYCIKS
ncbi:hypothetical protein [Bacillus alkalicellulosilyticus]|uniref:hypothetical protein n=1 Tax=Alkalihalobacterium alkalicellulosilyticum TaxID=1912214 RepID=UPI001FEBDC5D|nr:hypothetical protein [Bacillus alkalicellulosilyticus]